MHNPSVTQNSNRKNKDGTETVLSGNMTNCSYNKHMGFVDKANVLKSLYELDQKSKMWWHRRL